MPNEKTVTDAATVTDANAATATVTDANATATVTDANASKMFSQEDVNRMMSDNKKSLKLSNDNLVKELESVKSASTLSVTEKESLANQIEVLKSQHLTEQEKAQRTASQKEKLHGTEVKNLTETVSKWENLYSSEKIERDLSIAAGNNGAFNSGQIVAFLKNNTKLVQDIDDKGNVLDTLVTRVAMTVPDKDGKSVSVSLAPDEAVKRMKEDTENFGNLFKNMASGGLGLLNNANGVVSGSNGEMVFNGAADYRKQRAQAKKDGRI